MCSVQSPPLSLKLVICMLFVIFSSLSSCCKSSFGANFGFDLKEISLRGRKEGRGRALNPYTLA